MSSSAHDAGRRQFVYIDLGNVLVNFEHQQACENLAKRCGCSAQDARRELFDSGLEARYENGDVDTPEFCRELRTRLATDVDDDSLVLATSAIFRLNTTMPPLVSQLARSGAEMGVLSNTCEGHWKYCLERYRILTQCFTTFALSYKLRSMKPASAIYHEAALAVRREPEMVFFVDDRPENVQGALDAGWDAVLFQGAVPLGRELRKRGFEFNY